jgi:dihydrofolate synthase/folylpolyglutamate synthase
VLHPLVSLVTSIGYDHTDILGETLPEIAFEKAGIIKREVPVVISETQEEITEVFNKKASQMSAPIFFADKEYKVVVDDKKSECLSFVAQWDNATFKAETDLKGSYQLKNIPGVMKVMELLSENGFSIDQKNLHDGFRNVVKNTGLFGRWQKLDEQPLTICDTAHNREGVELILKQIAKIEHRDLHIVWGAVEGKKLDDLFFIMPKKAFYYFCEASVPRALPAPKLMAVAEGHGCMGVVITGVNEAIAAARNAAGKEDLVVIAGSNFIISEIRDLKK